MDRERQGFIRMILMCNIHVTIWHDGSRPGLSIHH